ncbi:MAG: hypothetical protein AAGG38_09340 [Planctomycetota bacterium]
MKLLTRRVLHAVIGNGYELKVERSDADRGVRLWLVSRAKNEEVFYFFDSDTELQVVTQMADRYCSQDQKNNIYSATATPGTEDVLRRLKPA